VQSAWLVISAEIWQKVGGFDETLEAAYEDLDYEMRAWDAGFNVKVASLNFFHLDKHTRFEEENYSRRWEHAMKLFSAKWKIQESKWL
jgi:GT2 family glycosyltransferase